MLVRFWMEKKASVTVANIDRQDVVGTSRYVSFDCVFLSILPI